MATHASHQAMVLAHHLEFRLVTPDPRDSLEEQIRGSGLDREFGLVESLRGIRAISKQVMRERLLCCWEACQGVDLVATSPLAMLNGYQVAGALGIPMVGVYFWPGAPTGDFPVWGSGGTQFGRRTNRLTHLLAHEFLWLMFRSQANQARRRILDLRSLPLRTPLASPGGDAGCMLMAYSSSFYPRASDWDSSVHVTGFWFLDREEDWQPPRELVTFLEDGSPPIYVGFGSMPSRSPEQMTEVVLAALRRLGQRAVLGSGWGGLTDIGCSDQFYVIDDVPYDWLFPRLAAAVHHGGIGTTAAALRAGIPSVTVPLIPEQAYHSWRVHQLGLGPKPLSRRRLTSDGLELAMRAVITSPTMRQRVSGLAWRIGQDDGVGRAVAAIQGCLGMHPARRWAGDRQLDAVE